jgi:hypothetical protein
VPRWRFWQLAFVAVVLVAAVESARAWQVMADLRDGRDLLGSAQARLESERLDVGPSSIQQSRREFGEAGKRFASARRTIEGDPLVRIARVLPGIRGQFEAPVELARLGEQAGAIGIELSDAMEAFAGVRDVGEETFPERTLVAFEHMDPHIASVEWRLRDVDRRRASLHDRSMLPPFRHAVRELDRREARLLEILALYGRMRTLAPSMLGFEGPRTYLVLGQNNAELLPTGGLISVAGTVTLENGRITQREFSDAIDGADDWLTDSGVYVEPPLPLKQYLLKHVGWSLPTSNWSPDFPTAARTAAYFHALSGGTPVDGVLAVNVTTLERVLDAVGAIYMPEFDVTVDKRNVFDLTEAHTRQPFEEGGDRKVFASLLAERMIDRALDPAPGTWSALLDALRELTRDEDLLLHSFHEDEAATIAALGWDGGVAPGAGGDYLMIVDASVNSTKLNAAIDQRADIALAVDAAGHANTTVRLTYTNELTAWARSREPDLVEKIMLGGHYGGYVRLFVPPGSALSAVEEEDASIGVEELAQEHGLSVFGRFFSLPRDARRDLEFTYRTPVVARPYRDGMLYRLTLRKQSGRPIEHVTLRIEPPPEMRIAATSLDGKERGHDRVLQFALTEDREIAVRFEPA